MLCPFSIPLYTKRISTLVGALVMHKVALTVFYIVVCISERPRSSFLHCSLKSHVCSFSFRRTSTLVAGKFSRFEVGCVCSAAKQPEAGSVLESGETLPNTAQNPAAKVLKDGGGLAKGDREGGSQHTYGSLKIRLTSAKITFIWLLRPQASRRRES